MTKGKTGKKNAAAGAQKGQQTPSGSTGQGGILSMPSSFFWGYIRKIESFSKWAFCKPGCGVLNQWFDAFFHPLDFSDSKDKGEPLLRGLDSVLLFNFISSLIFFAFYMILFTYMPQQANASIGATMPSDTIGFATNMIIFSPIINTVAVLAALLLLFAAARLVGGNGQLSNHLHSFSFVFCGGNFLLLLLNMLMFAFAMPPMAMKDYSLFGAAAAFACLLGFFASLIASLLLILYMLYAYFTLVRRLHSLSSIRTAIAMLAFIIFLFAIDFFANRVLERIT